ncbi:hypothetical protein PGAL8A_00177500 [Plasmodium gallinaceum]|uniref:Uncharacterized protein n=1 Tax=Plasmodium gallinaceum TaxID=5849 RepID=A0A1J1GNL0_PLAGA|nr:hypothetical protein PGAL8A_00177500 [Plasmodium gallinaceum]CRG94063.1 hypothetical protein PGAL8A_00177500 [Plasmodium gallinaceum]
MKPFINQYSKYNSLSEIKNDEKFTKSQRTIGNPIKITVLRFILTTIRHQLIKELHQISLTKRIDMLNERELLKKKILYFDKKYGENLLHDQLEQALAVILSEKGLDKLPEFFPCVNRNLF